MDIIKELQLNYGAVYADYALKIDSYALNSIPNKIFELKDLRKLSLRFTGLNDIPDRIENFSELEMLDLSGNNLSDLPDSLAKLKKLRDVNIWRNNFSKLPVSLTRLENLKSLSLGKNKIKSFPDDIGYFPETLKYLFYDENDLTDIPYQIFYCKNLVKLEMQLNRISCVPRELKNLLNLEVVDLTYNNITHLLPFTADEDFLYIDMDVVHWKRKNIFLKGNSLVSPPIEFIGRGKEYLRKYFELMPLPEEIRKDDSDSADHYYQTLKPPPAEILMRGKPAIDNYLSVIKGETDLLFEAKMIIVGEERAGKSTLANALMNDSFVFDPNKESTYGIDIVPWTIPKSDINADKDFHFNLWDFGGQEIYHATHQFFLTKRSVYLFVTEARKDIRFDDFYYWLNIINSLAGDSPVVIVLNKIDQGYIKISLEEYQKLFPQIICDIQYISCNSKLPNWESDFRPKLDSLKRNIFRIIKDKKLKGIGDPLPKVWVLIRNEIQELQKSNLNFISLAKFYEICEKYNQNKEQALYLSEYFHDLGIFLHFKEDIQLTNILFLNHRWVTKAIYNVLDCQKIKDAKGRFTDRDLIEIWNEPEFADKQSELLNLMKNPQFNICYQHGKYYFAPQLFDDKPCDTEWIVNENDLVYIFEYEFMPKGIITQLIVMMNENIYNNKYWKYGVILDYKQKCKAMVREIRFGKKNCIFIRLNGDLKKEFLIVLRSKIEEINRHYSNLRISEKIGCNCNECRKSDDSFAFNIEIINKAISKNSPSIQCGNSLELISVQSLIESFVVYDKSLTSDISDSKYDIILSYLKEIDDKLDDQFDYLIHLNSDEQRIDEIERAIENVFVEVNSQQSLNIINKITDYLDLLFRTYGEAENKKLSQIYNDLKKSEKWQTKVKLGIPLINLIGLEVEGEFSLNGFIKK
ncbi:MAG TPA: COR domain-containing protein [Bacteroidales bacterium]